jgi:hypothetical protein
MHLDMCLDIIYIFVEFRIQQILRHEDLKANMLPQQAAGFDASGLNLYFKEKPMQENSFVLCAEAAELARRFPESA